MLKKIVVTMAVIFAGFYMVTRPEESADAVQSAFDAVGVALTSLVRFFTSLVE
jgi:hypothetical protein